MRHGCITLTLVLCAAVAAGCDSSMSPTQPEQPPEGLEPAFLIGGSPLIINLVQLSSGLHGVDYLTTANRGVVEAKVEDRFLIRTSIAFFTKDGSQVADIVTCIDKPTPVKQTEITRGGDVAINGCIQIPATVWDAIMAAVKPGEKVAVDVTLELLLQDGSGGIHVLDAVNVVENLDPRSTPPAPQPNDDGEK